MSYYAAAAEPPNYADLIEAYSTLGAAAFTALAVVVTFWVWRHDQKRRREDQYAAEAAQARLITVGLEPVGSRADGWTGVKFRLRNVSPHSIYDTVLLLGLDLGENRDSKVFRAQEVAGSGMHEGEFTFSAPAPWRWGGRTPDTATLMQCMQATIKLTDSSGLRWVRNKYGRPFRDVDWIPDQRLSRQLRELLYLTAMARWLKLKIAGSDNDAGLKNHIQAWLRSRLAIRYNKQARREFRRQFGAEDGWEIEAERIFGNRSSD